VESNEWNDPDNVWFGSLKGISYWYKIQNTTNQKTFVFEEN
jgi:hypothetical protein